MHTHRYIVGLSLLLMIGLQTQWIYAEEPTFAGIKFGVGLSLTIDIGDHDRVNSAQLVDGIVRVDSEKNEIARIMLETHFFFTPDFEWWGLKPTKTWGLGPFIALQPGTNEIIEAIGGGLMLGFARAESNDKDSNDKASKSSWNIGIGFVVDPNVKVLGDGIEPNQPLPGNETEIRFKNTSQGGILLLVSFTF